MENYPSDNLDIQVRRAGFLDLAKELCGVAYDDTAHEVSLYTRKITDSSGYLEKYGIEEVEIKYEPETIASDTLMPELLEMKVTQPDKQMRYIMTRDGDNEVKIMVEDGAFTELAGFYYDESGTKIRGIAEDLTDTDAKFSLIPQVRDASPDELTQLEDYLGACMALPPNH